MKTQAENDKTYEKNFKHVGKETISKLRLKQRNKKEATLQRLKAKQKEKWTLSEMAAKDRVLYEVLIEKKPLSDIKPVSVEVGEKLSKYRYYSDPLEAVYK